MTGGKTELDGTFGHQGRNQKRSLNACDVDHYRDAKTCAESSTVGGGLTAHVVGVYMPIRGDKPKTTAKGLGEYSLVRLAEDAEGNCLGLEAQRHSGYGAFNQIADFDGLWVGGDRPDAPDYTCELQVGPPYACPHICCCAGLHCAARA